MENISFIPNTQKGSEGYIVTQKKHPYRGYIIGFILTLIIYIGALRGVYWFYIMRPTSEYTQILADLNAKNSTYYPKDDLERTVYSVNAVIAQTYDPVEIVKTIEATYGSNFKTTSWLYNKQKKTIILSAQASSFEYAIEQVAKIKGVKGVVDVTYPGIDKSSDGDGVELGLSIKLK